MTSPQITGYITGLRRSLPGPVADEAADGLTETYQQHLAAGASDHQAARAALADFGDLAMVVAEYTRQAPGRRAARLLLASGPAAGACWAANATLPCTLRTSTGSCHSTPPLRRRTSCPAARRSEANSCPL